MNDFLPVSKRDMKERGWDQLDFIYISGDAYVDHPSFGHAIISRILEANGFKVGIIPQPDWKNVEDFKVLGEPRLGFLVSSGNIDSMVNHYTVSRKVRNDDSYSPGGKGGKRPDRAVIVYCNMVRQAFSKIPLIIGGIEASLRRFAHYDYWDNKVRRSILIDSGADILSYGMGEKSIVEIAKRLKNGEQINAIKDIPGTVYIEHDINNIKEPYVECFSYKDVAKTKKNYAQAFKTQYNEQDPYNGKTVVQRNYDRYVVQNPPAKPLTTKEMDSVYSLSYMNNYHPMYENDGGVPAINEVKFSITSSRGCFGNCSFCALTFHQGRIVTSRSKKSIINEAKNMVWDQEFKGYIHDLGGPTANFRNPACNKQIDNGICRNKKCLYPTPCKNLNVSHEEYLEILRELRQIPKIKKVFIRSGIRYDYLIYDKNEEFFYDLVENHISGQLKVAPEHISSNVLKYMGKPDATVYKQFARRFIEINKELGKNQFLVPYLMSSHPGSTLKDAIELAEYLRDINYYPQQVQDFYPTPGTLSTCMFYTGLNPLNMKKVYVPYSYEEKAMQRALLQYKNPKNYELVYKALMKSGRKDLIGFDKKCLIRPKRVMNRDNTNKNKGRKSKKINRGRKKSK